MFAGKTGEEMTYAVSSPFNMLRIEIWECGFIPGCIEDLIDGN